MDTRPLHLFVLPSKNKNNKYIDLLISSIEASDSKVRVVTPKNDDLWEVLKFSNQNRAVGAKNIIHIHWPTVIYGSRFMIKSLFLLIRNVAIILVLKKFYNFKIVWTVHNFYSHDYPHRVIDLFGQKLVLAFSDCVVVQQKITLGRYKNSFPNKKVEFVPHGNYVAAYGPMQAKNFVLKRELGFRDDDIVVVSFGAIAPYKLNECIITSFRQVEDSRIKLLIIGKGNPKYVEKLTCLVSKLKLGDRVRVINRFVPDSEVPQYLSMADFSVFYYDDSEMTSGGIVLSLSYGVPVITRNIPASEIIGNTNGYVFRTQVELADFLKTLHQKIQVFSPTEITRNIEEQGWDISGKSLIRIYDSIS